MMEKEGRRRAIAVAAGLLLIYVVWGATHLAIRLAIEGIPPFLMAGARWIIAGVPLYVYARARGAARPDLAQWRRAAPLALCLIVGGNGLVTLSARYVPSGVSAVMLAVVPFWIVLHAWAGRERERPGARTALGAALGFGGVAFIAGPGASAIAGPAGLFGTTILLVSSLTWAAGSIIAARTAKPGSMLLASAMEMILGGIALSLLSVALREPSGFDLAAVSGRAWAGFAFLVIPGSIIAYTVYGWLLTATTPQTVVTRNFVNPIVAVALGWWLLDEHLSPGVLAAMTLTLVGVALHLIRAPARTPPHAAREASPVARDDASRPGAPRGPRAGQG